MLHPGKTGLTKVPEADPGSKSGNEILQYSGYIQIPADGSYTFSLTTDSGALLRIHDCTVIDEDYGYEAGEERSGTVMLQAGMHPFRLSYTRKAKQKPLLNLEWSGDGISKQAIPASAFFHVENEE